MILGCYILFVVVKHLFYKKNPQVCWLCGASKGMEDDLHMSITNVDGSAPWWGTLGLSNPWSVAPNFSKIIGFEISMLMPDLLHCWNLGVARHLLGSSMKIILSDQLVFPKSTISERLAMASESLKVYARQRRLPLRMKKITRTKLRWKTRTYPELTCSGFDAYVVGSWLEHTLQPHSATYPEILSMLWSSNKAVSLMYQADWFLTASEKRTLEHVGTFFNQVYVMMANRAINEHKLLWRVIPKQHMMCHVFMSKRWVNPAKYSTWMDEDFLKKSGKVLGLTAIKHSQQRLLERWLMNVPHNLNGLLEDSGTS